LQVIYLIRGLYIEHIEDSYYSMIKNKRASVAHAHIILAIWEAEIGRVAAQGQPQKTAHEAPSPK
jgi:hypothetical protein